MADSAHLAHEKGSGAACLKCGPNCDGLDLHFWRKICKNCKCKLEDHDVKIEENDVHHVILRSVVKEEDGKTAFQISKEAFERLTIDPKHQEHAKLNFTLMPKDATGTAIIKYMNAIPKEKAPHLTEIGKLYKQKQIIQQLPAHDFDENYCDNLSEKEKEKMKEFSKKREDDAAGQGQILEKPGSGKEWDCFRCHGKMLAGDVAIFAERAGAEKCWHPECFVCFTCEELLVDLVYFFKNSEIYCGRHYGELSRVRCAACDELIFTKEYTQAEGKNWHIKHFSCVECDAELGGQRYVVKLEHPYCLLCFEKKFAKTCAKCAGPIPADAKRVSYKEFHWHAKEACFNCGKCSTSLLGKQFILKKDQVYCSVECAKNS